MTFCVFAFASDGWVMAADRAELATWGDGCRTREMVTKICWDNTARTAGCYAGDTVARSITEDMFKEIRQGRFNPSEYRIIDDRRLAIEAIANQTLETERARLGILRFDSGYMRTVLAVLPSGDFGEVWKLQGVDSMRASLVPHIGGAIFVGDGANPAVFLPQRYYSTFHVPNRRSVDDLTFFAAHCVLESHFFNRNAVEGLDVLTFKQTGGFHFYEQSELDQFKKRSLAVSEMLSTAVFAPSPS